jgi:hypothetical protein
MTRRPAALGAAIALAACSHGYRGPDRYLGAALPEPCVAHDVEACLGWMVERDLADAALDLYDDAGLRDYVQAIAERLARGSRLARAPRIVIADHDGTYATSGSRIVIGRPTIERLDSEAELAGVLAHELAHIEGRHAVVSLYGPPPGDDQLILRRDAEAVADERAVALLERSGYSPAAMARALHAVLDAEDDEHPLRADRIARVKVMAGDRLGFEGRAELLARLEHMVVGRDSRLGRRIGDAWVVAALGLAIDLAPDDTVRDTGDVLVLRRGQAAVAAYAIGAPWGRELAAGLDDATEDVRALGRITLGSATAPPPRDDTPVGKLARAIRSTLPQPAIGTRVAVLERPRGALVIELGGRPGLEVPALGLREATADEITAAEPARIVIERAWRTGAVADAVICDGRLLDSPDRRVEAGDPIKCADRPLASRDRTPRLLADAAAADDAASAE